MTLRRRMAFLSLVAGLSAAVGVGGAFLWLPHAHTHPPGEHARPPAPHDDDEPPAGEEAVAVKTIHPKRDRSYTVTYQQFATVEPYFQADLRARASGVVKYIPKDIGAHVQKGELLVEIDVPDLRMEVAQKDAVVEQRRQELRYAKAQIKTASAHLEVAQTVIELAHVQVAQAKYTRDYREQRLDRFQRMLRDRATMENVVEEEKRDFLAAEAAWEAAKVAVTRAQADYREKEASLEAAQTDGSLKEALIDVALRDRDRT